LKAGALEDLMALPRGQPSNFDRRNAGADFLAKHAKSIQEDHNKSTATPDTKARAAANRTPDFSAA